MKGFNKPNSQLHSTTSQQNKLLNTIISHNEIITKQVGTRFDNREIIKNLDKAHEQLQQLLSKK